MPVVLQSENRSGDDGPASVRDCRRKGFGRAAFECLRASVFADNLVTLEVLDSNPVGMDFWKAVGMRPYSRKLDLDPSTAG